MPKYGSIINGLIEGAGDQTPEVGMGATLLMWSDRMPYVITKVLSDRRIEAVRVDYTIENYQSGYGEVHLDRVISDPETFTLRKNGRWIKKGQSFKQGSALKIGEAAVYRDPLF